MRGCAHCDALQRQVRELQEELAEWRASDQGDAAADTAWSAKVSAVLRLKRIKSVGRFVTPGDMRFLKALITAAPRPVSHDALLEASARYGLEPRGDVKVNVVRASICRALLASQGFSDAIISVHAYGYEMPKAVAKQVQAWLDGLVAS
ncbi:hypothetical protein [Caulobacter sp. 3R27C2-B]|mgnify:CR=1 FL=1|uniref:hypothetical protein n=1 Tax=Caulobacter sp. 3R27C2-B TaxID=2502219 RepID=UPI0010F7667C|nr:hypothetical protein [Caulobacter sp. 3R27C2-B]